MDWEPPACWYEPYWKAKDFNVARNDEGMWWVAVKNPEMKDDPAAKACTRDPFRVDNGKNPGVPQAIDTETLAGLAHQRTVVPPTKPGRR
ncbi:hypothetical protein [Streptomyces tibetensis]|uniref:hypothetical protein n=1 Tax=Streptomyces tibetensis TaxID=2382123 RepID=UPI0033ECAA03